MLNKGKYISKTKPSVFKQKRLAEEREFRRYYPLTVKFEKRELDEVDELYGIEYAFKSKRVQP